MLAEWVLGNPAALILIVLLIFSYWALLGGKFDSSIFISLNFSIISIWAVNSDAALLYKLTALAYIGLFIIAYASRPPKKLAPTIDTTLQVDLSPALLAISMAALISNLSSGFTLLEQKSLILEQQAEVSSSRYWNYILISANWLTVHVICTAGSSRKWTLLQRTSVLIAFAAALTGLSKASALPIILTLLFVHSDRLSRFKMLTLAAISVSATLFLIRQLLDAPIEDVSLVFFSRILQNVDVLDYINLLGERQIESYPHRSPFYLIWPAFQLTQDNFTVAGTWLHGTLTGDWRGYGPNTSFIIDQLIASYYIGLPLALLFGLLLRAGQATRFRVFVALVCYSFLQDWYFACLNLLMFTALFFCFKAFRPLRLRRRAQLELTRK